MEYIKSKKYDGKELQSKIMGPNPIKLEEELLINHKIKSGATVCDLGSGQGLTSVFLVKEYGFKTYACDLWSDPQQNQQFFSSQGLSQSEIKAVKADATNLPFQKDFFDALICIDSYNYFGRDEKFLDEKLLPFIKNGGYLYLAITGMKKDCHNNLPNCLTLSWTPEQLEYMHDIPYWKNIFDKSKGFKLLEISEMQSNKEVWEDWLKQENEYAVGDRKSINAGALNYLNFIKAVLVKK